MTRALSKTDVYRENASETLTKITNFWLTECWAGEILLMEEILHHLGCMKPCKYWDFNYQPQLVNPGFLNHQQYLHDLHHQKSPEFPLFKYGCQWHPNGAATRTLGSQGPRWRHSFRPSAATLSLVPPVRLSSTVRSGSHIYPPWN